jgi:tetratricopeptide (TPR) repeat protein
MIERGVEMAPEESELHIQNARNAAQRRDWPEALLRWQIVQSRFDARFLGHLGTAQCLKQLGRFDEAEEVLADARERFYRVNWIFAEWADLAAARGDLKEAADRWVSVLKRFPTFSFGYLKGTQAIRKIGRTEEADELLGLAVERMRSDLPVHLEYARGADQRGDLTASVERWALVRERFPDCVEVSKREAHASRA